MSDERGRDEAGRDDLEAAIAENPEAVAALVRRLDAVNELLDVLALGEGALTDEMVVSLAETGASVAELADVAAEDDTRRGLETLLAAIGTAERSDPEPVGPVGLVRKLRDADVRRGLGYLLAVVRAVGRSLSDGD